MSDSCEELKELAINLAGEGNAEHSQAEEAVDKMGREDCTEALREVAEELTGQGNAEHSLAQRALEKM